MKEYGCGRSPAVRNGSTSPPRTANDHWGPWHCPLARSGGQYDKDGLLSMDKYSAFAVERLDTGELVGLEEYGAMHPGNLGTWIGTYIRPEHRRRGFGVEAKQLVMCHLFENFPLNVIMADTVQTHKPARRGMELAGMKLVGARRRAHCYHGKYVDVVWYAIMRSEWEQLPVRGTVRRGQ